MNILVLVKQVPNTTEMKINKEHGTLMRQGVESIINPDDLASVEFALTIKDEQPDTHVRVISMGPPQAKSMLTDLYGLGVDDCVLISDPSFSGADTWATSNTLAAAISRYPFDLILAGRQAIDGDTAQVGPQVAQRLGIPQITYVKQIESVTSTHVTVSKHYEDYIELSRCKYPCLLTCLSEGTSPRLGRIEYIWKSLDQPITVLSNQQLQLDPSRIGLKGSYTKVKRTFVRPIETKGQMIVQDIELAAKTIADILKKAAS